MEFTSQNGSSSFKSSNDYVPTAKGVKEVTDEYDLREV